MTMVPDPRSNDAGIVTVNAVAELNTVARGALPAWAVEVAANPDPDKSTVTSVFPATTRDGETADNVGSGLFTVKRPPAALPPPGAGFVTPTGKLPPLRRNPAVRVALSAVLETKVVGTGVPASVTVEPLVKFDPFTVSSRSAAPALAVIGVKDDSVGVTLRTPTENEALPPPGAGFAMRPERVPGLIVEAAVRLNVIDELETTPETPPSDAVVDEPNPAPVTVTVVAPPPAGRTAGETLVTLGTGLAGAVTVNTSELLLPPPGAGLETLTGVPPTATRALLGIITVMAVLLLLTGDKSRPPNWMLALAAKLFPDKVRKKLGLPTAAVVGAMLAKTGTELVGTVKAIRGGDEGPGPGLLTPMLNPSPAGVGASVGAGAGAAVCAGVGAAVGSGDGVARATRARTVNVIEALPAARGFASTIVSFTGFVSSVGGIVTLA
jgi:hypothetical protein